MDSNSSEQDAVDAIEEIERCLWRAQDAAGDAREDHLDEADSEVMSLVRGLADEPRLVIMDRLVKHLEDQAGMDAGLIEEVFNYASISRQDLDAYRLSQAAPTSSLSPPKVRI